MGSEMCIRDSTSFGVDFDVAGIVRRLDQEDILIPEWQRSYIWNIKLASSFVESLLLSLPVPGVFIGTDPDSEQLYVIDGQQRLKTLQYFYRGEFLGSGRTFRAFNLLGVQSQFDGASYDSLDVPSRRTATRSLYQFSRCTTFLSFNSRSRHSGESRNPRSGSPLGNPVVVGCLTRSPPTKLIQLPPRASPCTSTSLEVE